jgi:DNA-directed RNA polymerase subunit M/transcription elongation factor TFIIS
MASGTYFIRSCPTCGRHLQVRVELLNREVECSHCGAGFLASENVDSSVSDWRIEQALARTQQFLSSVGSTSVGSPSVGGNATAGELR